MSVMTHVIPTAPTAGTGMRANLHWTLERIVMVSMIPIFPLAFAFDCQIINMLAVTTVSLHGFWGLDGVLKDYVMERRYGPILQPVLRNLWKVLSAASLAGFMYFEYHDIGFVNAVKKIWTI